MKTKNNLLQVSNPFNGDIIDTVVTTSADQFQCIISNANKASALMTDMSRFKRCEILSNTANLLKNNQHIVAKTLSEESGKPITQAKKEVLRCINTLQTSAEEAKRISGEIVPFDSFSGNDSKFGYYIKEPLGIILAITPFNDPLNLVAHKIGPALAAGNAVLLKPSEKTPLSALLLLQFLQQSGLPDCCLQILLGDEHILKPYLECKDIRMVSFTGGMHAGEKISKLAGLKRLSMDLGGNAANIVLKDCNLKASIDSCLSGGYWANGQNCISVQRVLVQDCIADDFIHQYTAAVTTLKAGDPGLESTFIGPLIDSKSIQRIQQLIDSALQAGASLECGGYNNGNIFSPTVLSNVPTQHPIWLEEVFGPVVCINRFQDFDEAIAIANEPEYALHAAIFTNNLEQAMSAIKRLHAGGIMINESSDFRYDGMPFGGSKLGSMGREGVKFAIEEMSQTKVVCFNQLAIQQQ